MAGAERPGLAGRRPMNRQNLHTGLPVGWLYQGLLPLSDVQGR